jgi:hypothetical protein
MLVGNSLPEYLFIRTAITVLRLIAPFSLVYLVYVLVITSLEDPRYTKWARLPFSLEVYLGIESAFYLLVYFPLKIWLQRDALHPEPPSKAERRILFQRCLESVQQPDTYLIRWFLNAPMGSFGRENVKEFFAWSFMNKPYEHASEDELAELETYVDQLEEQLGVDLPPGRGSSQSLRGTLDSVPMQHRPLIWYLVRCSTCKAAFWPNNLTDRVQIVFLVDISTNLRLRYYGYRYQPSTFVTSVATFPPRPLHILPGRKPRRSRLPYWYREHTSKTKQPILFIHGIGICLFAYVDFLAQLGATKTGSEDEDEGQVGIIALELLPISSRITLPALDSEAMIEEIQSILDLCGWEDIVLVGHSSVLTASSVSHGC